MPLVGLVGDAACGKDTVARVFERFGFVHQSSSDLVREEIYRRGQTPSRELQTRVANEVRKSKGENYFVVEAIKKATQASRVAKPVVVSGLYAPAEGIYVKSVGGSIVEVAGMESETLDDQYARVVRRAAGDRDAISYEEFLQAHDRENGGLTPDEANIAQLAAIADFRIVHNGRISMILPQVEEIVGALSHD
jgi:dephospho-CoA kinase